MKDVVSHRTTSVVGWVASLWIICSILSVYGSSWPVPASGSLVLAAACLMAMRANSLIRPVRAEFDHVLAVAMPSAPHSTRRAGLLPRDKRTR
jgi:hypothetical protein